MALNVNETDIENVVVETNLGETELDEVYVNDVLVWQRDKTDEFILRMKPTLDIETYYKYPPEKNCICLDISCNAETECSVTIDDQTKVVSAGSTDKKEEVRFYFDISDTQERLVYIRGRFNYVESVEDCVPVTEENEYAVASVITGVEKWYKYLNYLITDIFKLQDVNFDVVVPKYMTKIRGNGFNEASSLNFNLILPDNIVEIEMPIHKYPPKNADASGYLATIGKYVIGTTSSLYGAGMTGLLEITTPPGVEILPNRMLGEVSTGRSLNDVLCPESVYSLILRDEGLLTKVPSELFYNNSSIKQVDVCSTIDTFETSSLSAENMAKMTFRQPKGMKLLLPPPGNGSGAFYHKRARSVDIYTENEDIMAYDWMSDNITPTFYHLDGTLWEE